MAELVTSAATNAAGNLATEYASPYLSYFFRFGKIVDDFKFGLNGLEGKIDRVKNDVDAATRQTEVIEKDVKEWLIRAEKELREAQGLKEEIERKKCFNWCPNWGWQYCLSRKVAKKTISISKLLETSDFPRMGYRAPLQGIELLQSKNFIPSKSSSSTFKQIIDALNADSVNMIGLYGMPGVGKTTLAKEILKHAKEQKLFDKLVMVTVSQTPSISNIQARIAELLGLKFEASTEEGKAEELLWAMNGVKKILIIIDDVWNEFELQSIGIPFGVHQHEGLKILLTTRHQQICGQMNCQQKFELGILSENEAWDLFKNNASLKDESSRLNDVAKEVARECKGLPLAIVTVGKALKGKTLGGWEATNQRFKDSRSLDNEGVCRDIYKCLKLSYDNLEGHNIRLCFLLCSFFPEDCEIFVELLTMFAIGEALFSDIYLLNNLRREIHEALRKLHECGLLLKNDDDGDNDNDDETLNVKMHDVVRDFAHWITSTGENKFMIKEELTEWPSKSFESYTAISFSNSNINNFPEKLNFPKLKILVFEGKELTGIPSSFFKGVKALQFLLLGNVIFSLEACKFLRNLRILWLINCQLENISSLTYMKNLEILLLLDTNVNKLLAEEEVVAVLHRLKSLHICNEEERINFPPKLLSSLTSLQELQVLDESNINLLELNSLSRLTELSLCVSSLPANFVFPKLQRYYIYVNKDVKLSRLGSRSRTGTLEIDHDCSSSLKAFEELFCNVKSLTLENVREHKNIVPSVDPEGLNELTYLWLGNCNDLECLMDTTAGEKGTTSAFSNLVNLVVMRMSCLKELCHGPTPIRFLHKLKDVKIEVCEELKVVFQMDGVLEKVGEHKENQTLSLSNLNCLELSSLPKLKRIWKGPTHLFNLQSLKTMTIKYCHKLAYLFSTPLAHSLVNLEALVVKNCESLEHVIIEEAAENEDQIALKLERLQQSIVLRRLQILELENLENLSSFCPENFVMSLSLKDFQVRHCPRLTRFCNRQGILLQADFKGLLCNAKSLTMDRVTFHKNLIPNVHREGLNEITSLRLEHGKGLEYLIDTTDQGTIDQGHVSTNAFFNLVELVIEEMIGLKMLCKGRFPKGFMQKLERLEVENCMEMVSLSPGLQNLKKVKIIKCGQLQQVFEIEELLQDLEENKAQLLSNLTSLELKFLPKLKWIWKGPCHYVSLQSLKVAAINGCNRLKSLFSLSLAQSLLLLEELFIANCDGLEHIITPGLEVDQAIAFPRLQHLELIKLINLSCFCSENYSMVSPSLEKLIVKNCPVLENFAIQQVNKEVQLQNVPLHDSKAKGLCNAKTLEMDGVMCHKNLIPNIDPEGLNGVTLLTLERGKGLECLIDTTDQGPVPTSTILSNLTSLKLQLLSELKWIWKGPSHYFCLQSLKVAKIIDCNRLKYLFSSSLAQSLVVLEELRIGNCDGLEYIITTGLEVDDNIESEGGHDHHPSLFPKLKFVLIYGCPRLEYVSKIPLGQGLPHLEYLSISDAAHLKQVFKVSKERNGVDDAIAFPCLQYLHLIKLIKLSCFCSENYPVVLPSLEKLTVKACPVLENLVIQQVNIEVQLKELHLCELENDMVSNLIQKIFQIEVGHFLSRTEALKVIELENENQLQGPIQAASLQYLVQLALTNCNRLKSLFSFMLARNIPQLEILKIKSCQELEEIIEMDQASIPSLSQCHLHPISFPSLQEIWIDGCSNLKSLFPISVIPSLSNLQWLSIKGASKLEQVFVYQGEPNIEHYQKETVFPELWSFNLSKLPSLKRFAPTGYHFHYPFLGYLEVTECPTLTTSSSMDPKTPVHAITEAPQQVLNSATEHFTIMKETAENQSSCNDIIWSHEGPKPLYVTLGETKIIIKESVESLRRSIFEKQPWPRGCKCNTP